MNNPNYSDYLQIKERDKKGKEFRKKLLDLVKFARTCKDAKWFSKRSANVRFVESSRQIDPSFSLGDLMSRVKYLGLDPNDCYFKAQEVKDWEGVVDFCLQLYTTTPETDMEYFNRLGEIISPSKHQIKQAILDRAEYEEYIRLKSKFEGKGA